MSLPVPHTVSGAKCHRLFLMTACQAAARTTFTDEKMQTPLLHKGCPGGVGGGLVVHTLVAWNANSLLPAPSVKLPKPHQADAFPAVPSPKCGEG